MTSVAGRVMLPAPGVFCVSMFISEFCSNNACQILIPQKNFHQHVQDLLAMFFISIDFKPDIIIQLVSQS
jgi:hypothetical protein